MRSPSLLTHPALRSARVWALLVGWMGAACEFSGKEPLLVGTVRASSQAAWPASPPPDEELLRALGVDPRRVRIRQWEGELEPFFDALSQLKAHLKSESPSIHPAPVRVLLLGDSHIAAGLIADDIRRRLQDVFGSGGRGFVRADQWARYGGRRLSDRGWESLRLVEGAEGEFGAGASALESVALEGARAEVAYAIGSEDREVDVIYHPPQAGGIQAGAHFATTAYRKVGALGVLRVELSSDLVGERLPVEATHPGVRLLGTQWYAKRPGLMFSSIGEISLGFTNATRVALDTFESALKILDPDLFLIMLGGNDAAALRQRRTTLDDIRFESYRYLRRLRRARPQTPCLIMAPMDAGHRAGDGRIVTAPGIEPLRALLEEQAKESGCAFWDTFQAMGGKGSFGRWLQKGLLNPDLIHPYRKGGDLIGYLFTHALRRAYLEYRPGRVKGP